MAQKSKAAARPTPAATPRSAGPVPWTRARTIYLAAGILACIAGVVMIVVSR
ncbi:hypothetical protein [Pseudarthrobacter siccitolerans]